MSALSAGFYHAISEQWIAPQIRGDAPHQLSDERSKRTGETPGASHTTPRVPSDLGEQYAEWVIRDWLGMAG